MTAEIHPEKKQKILPDYGGQALRPLTPLVVVLSGERHYNQSLSDSSRSIILQAFARGGVLAGFRFEIQ